jgi:histidine ammonia-lyase
MMCAAQGLEYRAPLKAARRVDRARAKIREYVARLDEDRVLSGDIEILAQAVRDGAFDQWAN